MKKRAILLSLRLPIAPIRRYVLAVLLYGSWKKLLNLIRCEFAKRLRIVRTSAFPFVLTLDSANVCNLRCPYCLTGQGLAARPRSEMNLAHLEKLLAEAGGHILLGNIGNWGEPFISRKVIEIVRMLHQRKIYTTISSNLSISDPSVIREACDVGLDYLIVSIDGASADTYGQYRRKGRFDLVLANLADVLRHKKSRGRAWPIVEWQFIKFAHNRHEVSDARRLARSMGVDVFRAIRGVAPPDEDVGGRALFQPRVRDSYCQQLWHVVALNVDGGIAPCCYLYKKEEDFGSIAEQSLRDIRASERYRIARSFFLRRAKPVDVPADHPCSRCELVTDRLNILDALGPEDRIISRRFAGPRILS